MTNPLDNKDLELKKELFINKVKIELSDKFKSLQQIKNIYGEDPRPLHEIVSIWTMLDKRADVVFEDTYEIDTQTQQKVLDIFKSIFSINMI